MEKQAPAQEASDMDLRVIGRSKQYSFGLSSSNLEQQQTYDSSKAGQSGEVVDRPDNLERLRQALPQLECRVASHREQLRTLQSDISSSLCSEVSLAIELFKQYEADDSDRGPLPTAHHRSAEASNEACEIDQPLADDLSKTRQTRAFKDACDGLIRHFQGRKSSLENSIISLEGQLSAARQLIERYSSNSGNSPEPKSAKEAFDALVDSLKGKLSDQELADIQKEEAAVEAATHELESTIGALEERCREIEKDVSWNLSNTAEALRESCSLLSAARLEGQSAWNKWRHWTLDAAKARREAELAEEDRRSKEREVERLKGRLQHAAEELELAKHHLEVGNLENLSPEERSHFIQQKIRSYDRAIKCIATLSPLFMVERTPKYVILQYKCPDNTDLEIIIDKLDCDEKVVTVKPRRPGLEEAMMSKLRFVSEEAAMARIISRELSYHFVDYSRPVPFNVTLSPTIGNEAEV